MEDSKTIDAPLLGMFNECFPPVMDGVSIATQNYAYWLSKKTKNNTCVITPKFPGYNDHTSYPVYRYSSFYVPFRKPYRFGFPLIDWNFNTQIDNLPFGLVHAHCPFSSGKIAMQIAKKRHIPIVATFHSKYKMDFARIIPNKYVLRYIVQSIVNFYDNADEVWIPQAAVEETLREYGYKGKVEVVENGNDFKDECSSNIVRSTARKELNIPADENVFLFVGQHVWEKNIYFLIQALAQLHDFHFQMFFIGTGYAAKDLKKKVEELGLSPRVNFIGQLNNRDLLKKYYAAADLFLFPSLYDNAPLVVREAAAMQTPSLLIKESTAAEIIKHKWNGFLAPADVDAYAEQIRKLIHRPKEMQRVGYNASRTIVRPWSDVVDEVLDRYIHLINRE